MNQTYLYRKHLRTPLSYLLIYVSTIFIGIALLTFGLFFTDRRRLDTTLVLIICIVLLITYAIITIEFVILYFLLFRKFREISVTLTEDSIIYTKGKSCKIIPYSDIISLRFPSIKYAGGWVKIKYHGGTIRLTVVLEEIGDFISKLKEKLDELGMNQVYNEKKLFSFYKTAVFSDESWDRIYRNFKSYVLINFLSIIINTIVLGFSNISRENKALLYGSIFAPLVGLLLSEILIGMRVRKRVDCENLTLLPRDIRIEHKTYFISVIISSCAYSIILVVFGLL
ncbi:MAG: hypothetical protein K0R34_3791 [Herbinix sp.]|jgi:hypothetical protein|nr:hypothetical protein [Herbinix sp.]